MSLQKFTLLFIFLSFFIIKCGETDKEGDTEAKKHKLSLSFSGDDISDSLVFNNYEEGTEYELELTNKHDSLVTKLTLPLPATIVSQSKESELKLVDDTCSIMGSESRCTLFLKVKKHDYIKYNKEIDTKWSPLRFSYDLNGHEIKKNIVLALTVKDKSSKLDAEIEEKLAEYRKMPIDSKSESKSMVDSPKTPAEGAKAVTATDQVQVHTDTDGDGIIDSLDLDDDNDGEPDATDDLPKDKNDTKDNDNDGIGNNADPDDDNDGILDVDDIDKDGDGIENLLDAFLNNGLETVDSDGDGIGNNADAFPNDKEETLDTDNDGIGNNADPDDDNDGVTDILDAFPKNKAETVDSDNDGIGDNADAFPNNPAETNDNDSDGLGDNADLDDDNDGVNDINDAFPFDQNETQDLDNDGLGDNADAFPHNNDESLDTDNDGLGNLEDLDDDGDSVNDVYDAMPLDNNETKDSDGDGIGNNADPDDDNDGELDVDDATPTDHNDLSSLSGITLTELKGDTRAHAFETFNSPEGFVFPKQDNFHYFTNSYSTSLSESPVVDGINPRLFRGGITVTSSLGSHTFSSIYLNYNLQNNYFIGYEGSRQDDVGTIAGGRFDIMWDMVEGEEFIEKTYPDKSGNMGTARPSFAGLLDCCIGDLPTNNKSWETSGLTRIRASKIVNQKLYTWEPRQEGSLFDYFTNLDKYPRHSEVGQKKQLVLDILEGICRMHNYEYDWTKNGVTYTTRWWHDDLKFQNIFRTDYKNGVTRAQVADFDYSHLSYIAGTWAWWPPEYIRWEESTPPYPYFSAEWYAFAADWGVKKDSWQVGLLLSGILMGELPYKENSVGQKEYMDASPLPSFGKAWVRTHTEYSNQNEFWGLLGLTQEELTQDIKDQKLLAETELKPLWNIVYNLTRIDLDERMVPLDACEAIGIDYKN